jgi:phage N-6-adenine-methyltransferase
MENKDSDVRSTPVDFFNHWNKIFRFELDVCANSENAKCENYYTIKENGLEKPWGAVNWCNPPYPNGQINKWLKKARVEQSKGKTTVALVPGDTSTKWYQDNILDSKMVTVVPVRRRLKFENQNGAKFASHIVIFWGIYE